MSWEHQYTDTESNIDFTLSHTYLYGRGAIKSAGFVITDELLEAIKNRDPKIFEILEVATQYHELVFFVKDLEGGGDFEEDIKAAGSVACFRANLKAVLACESPMITPRDREVAQRGLDYLDNRERILEQAEAQKSYTQKRRKQFNKDRADLWDLLVARDGELCAECGDTEDLSIDHKSPLSKGGSDDPENLQILCRKHNSKKGTRIPAESELIR